MPFIRVDTQKSFGKKTDKKRVIVCACDYCGNETMRRFKSSWLADFESGEKLAYCDRKCANAALKKGESTNMKITKTSQEKYGEDWASKSTQVKQKIEETCLDRYGSMSYLGSDSCKHALQEFLAERGVTAVALLPEVKEKIRQTSQERYGCDFAIQSQEIKEKVRSTCLEKYGATSYRGSAANKAALKRYLDHHGVVGVQSVPEVKEKTRQTSRDKYGVDHCLQAEEVKQKTRDTCMNAHGVPWPTLIPEVNEKRVETLRSAESKSKRRHTMRKNGTIAMHTSKGETKFYERLNAHYQNVTQHPIINGWSIDMYIADIDTYVNYNGTYWHGKDKTLTELALSKNQQDVGIAKTKMRDELQMKWFAENDMKLVVVWEGAEDEGFNFLIAQKIS